MFLIGLAKNDNVIDKRYAAGSSLGWVGLFKAALNTGCFETEFMTAAPGHVLCTTWACRVAAE